MAKKSRQQKAELNCQFHLRRARFITNYQSTITSYQLPINGQQSVTGSSGLAACNQWLIADRKRALG
ncbi:MULTISPECIES: hypothetical protein [unclassified Microcoleus]|uniref:hypothetical protein n=1 Tax=unclassified Microcoleus TaxID=2642155 RepID=UPI002FCF09BD